MTEAPGREGFRLPGEFEPHESTWMAWPHDERTWIAGLAEAETAVLDMIEALSHGERVDLIVRSRDREHVEECLSTRRLGEVRLHEKDYADAWLRDTGPTVLVRGTERRAVDWRFDAWGGKYEELKRDDDIAAFVAEREGIPCVRVDEVCEGGAFDANGRGRILSTRECLVENRNHASAKHVESLFERVLGAEEVLWLRGGLEGDDTDGHVDTVARFVAEDHVAIATPWGPSDPDGEVLEANRRRLAQLAGPGEDGLEVLELPQPAPVEVEGARRPATYANFYVGNEVVLLPTFGDPHDEVARRRLGQAFPERRVVDVPARALVAGYGACHCLTQPIPEPEAG